MTLLLIPLLLAGAVVAAVVVSVQRRGDGGGQVTGTTVRQFFQYLILAGLVLAAGSGLTGLLGRALRTFLDPGTSGGGGESLLALQITFTLIALPLWLALAWWTLRRQRAEPEEGRSALWAAYLTLVRIISLLVVLFSCQSLAVGLLHGPDRPRPGTLAQVVVWLGVWWLHGWWARRSTAPDRLRLERLLGTGITLVAAAVGLITAVETALTELLGLSGDSLVTPVVQDLLEGVALLVVAGVFWAIYWLRDLRRSTRDTGWLALVLLLGVGASLVAAITAASLLLWSTLVWLVGEPGLSTMREHFLGAPGQLATVAVGLLVWWYHQEVLEARRAGPRNEVRRVYEYLMSAVGLGAAAAGLVMVLVTVVEALSVGADLVVGGHAVNALVGALVLLGVGLPVWWWHWRLAQQARAQDPAREVGSPMRRFYLLVLFGLMGIAAVIALLTLVYLVLEDALAGELGAETLRTVRFSIGVLVTASLLSAYHWTIFRADRELVPEVSTAGRDVGPASASTRGVLLVGPAHPRVVAELTDRTDAQVQLLVRTDGAATPWSVEALAEAVEAAPPGDLVVLAGSEGMQVVPVTRWVG